jgi:protein CpxP
MTRNTKIIAITASIAAAAMTGFSTYVAHAGTTEATPAKGRFAAKLAQLGVTGAQRAQVKDILRKYQPTVGPMVRHLVDARRALRDTIRAGTVDESAIRAQAAKVASLEADLAVQRAHVSHDIRGVLTPEQIETLQEMQVDTDARIDAGLSRIAKHIAEE